MPVELWTGRTGAGKTYAMVYRTVITRIANPTRPVYTNMTSLRLPGSGPVYHLRDYRDFLAVRSGLVLLDEVNLVLPSRAWKHAPGSLLYKLSHVRKHDLDLWCTAQHLHRVDPVLRELVHTHAEMHSMRRLGFFWARVYDGATQDRRHFISLSFLPWLPRVARLYDTLEEIQPERYVGVEDIPTLTPDDWAELRLQ